MTSDEYHRALIDIQQAYIDWRIDHAEFKKLSEELLLEYETQADT